MTTTSPRSATRSATPEAMPLSPTTNASNVAADARGSWTPPSTEFLAGFEVGRSAGQDRGGRPRPRRYCCDAAWRAWRSARAASGARRLALQPEQAAHVVDEVGEADLGRRPRKADGAHEQTHPVLLLGEDVLDMSPYGGLRRVRLGRAARHRAPLWLLAMDVAHEHALAQKVLVFPRAIGRISPDAAGRVRAIEQIG